MAEVYKLRGWQVGARKTYNWNMKQVIETTTCGHCGRSWNDALITSRTPAPSARCPFEDEHVYSKKVRNITYSI